MRSARKNYINGNYFVNLDYDGTKKRRTLRVGEDFKADFPDSIDLKITDRCGYGCPYCHESSGPTGKHADLDKIKNVLDALPVAPIELAIGGGDVLTCPDLFLELTRWTCDRGFQNRVTLNYRNFLDQKKRKGIDQELDFPRIFNYSNTLGISLDRFIPEIREIISELVYYSKIVYHIIPGVFPLSDLAKLLENDESKVLILGYKQWGRAFGKPLPPELPEWSETIRQMIYKSRFTGPREDKFTGVLGFDNLAIEQLGLRDCLLEEEWKTLYQGDEFTSSMYIDAVNETFAPTSRDPERMKWSEIGILEYFKKYNKSND